MKNEILLSQIYGFEVHYSYEKKENGLIKIDYPKNDNKYTINFLAYGPEFGIVSKALEDATYINHITGAPFIRTSILYAAVFEKAIIEINFIDNSELQTIKVSDCNLGTINYNLIKIIAKRWIQEVL